MSSAVSLARQKVSGSSTGGSDGGGEADVPPPPPSPAQTVARAQARRSGVRAAAEGSFAAATSTANDITPGMPATPTRRGDDSDRDA